MAEVARGAVRGDAFVTARVLRFPRPLCEEVELAWCTHRAFSRAEAADPSLLNDPAHVKARNMAEARFEQLYGEWCRR